MIHSRWLPTLIVLTVTIDVLNGTFPEDRCLVNILKELESECNYLVYTLEHRIVTTIIQSEFNVINTFIKKDVHVPVVYAHSYLYIIVADSVADYYNFLKVFQLSLSWYPQQKILIIYSGESGMKDLLRLSHAYLTHQLYILIKSQFISYFPFENGSCIYSDVIQNHNCSTFSTFKVTKRNMFLKFKDCQLRVTALPFEPYVINASDSKNPGLDMQIIKEVTKCMNISVILQKNPYTSWGGLLENGTYTLMYGLLARRETDILIGMIHANTTVDEVFSSTIIHMQDHVNFFVPAALPVNDWKVLFFALECNVWLLLFTTFAIMCLISWFVARNQNALDGYKNLEYCFLKIICTWFSSHSRLPQKNLLRYLFTMWCYSSIIMNSIYQGKLMSYLTKPIYEKQISTMEELSESRLLKGGFPTLKSHLSDKENNALERIKKTWFFCELDYSCINRTAEKRDLAVAKSVIGVNYNIPKMFLDSNGRSKLFQIRDTMSLYLVRFTTIKGLPFFDRMNSLIARLIETGIINKWLNDLQFDNNQYEHSDEFRKINIEHIQLILIIFLSGNALAVFVFILELLSNYWKTT